jgi:hypothetical protein
MTFIKHIMSAMNLTKKEIDAQIDTFMSISSETRTCFQSIKRINLLKNNYFSIYVIKINI